MTNALLHKKIDSLPEQIKSEVMHYLDFLLQKKNNSLKKKRSKAGFLKGTFVMKENFDEPLEDFKEYME
ncbi:MAG: DUF2281 domain-containing protein [Ignavibacteria bacterium]|nr:DUF2281 domain-containing protein [Ignavibacteria bacterium]